MKTLFTLLFSLHCFLLFAPPQQEQNTDEKRTKVDFIRADKWTHDDDRIPGAEIITQNVIFRHDSTYLYCDTAYFYRQENYLEAFGNVRMEQGDTLFIYGDHLYYDGNEKLARLRKNIRMINNDVTLLTDSFNYDRQVDLAYFFDGGVIIDQENELTSVFGQYNPKTKDATFQYDVKLKNPKMDLFSDTLVYSTDSKIATITGPSRILSDSTVILSDRGWYDTQSENAMLLDRSTIINKNTTLTGDSIYYERLEGIAQVFGNMFVNDTVQKSILKGDYGFYNELIEYAMTTDSAVCIDYSTVDTMFIHGDTIKAYTEWGNNPIPEKRQKLTQEQRDSIEISRDSIFTLDDYLGITDTIAPEIDSLLISQGISVPDSLTAVADSLVSEIDSTFRQHIDSLTQEELYALADTLEAISGIDSLISPLPDILTNSLIKQEEELQPLDSIYKMVIAYNNVRIYGERMQAVCDSMTISSQDTIINMYHDPIIWNEENQIFGDFIQIYMNDSTIEKAHVQGNVFLAQQIDSIHFNQLSGREMFAYFDGNGEITQIDLNGNVNVKYYNQEKSTGEPSGLMIAEGSFMIIFMKDRQMDKIKFIEEMVGVVKPMEGLTQKNMFLNQFQWYNYIRPKDKNDIFRRVKKASK